MEEKVRQLVGGDVGDAEVELLDRLTAAIQTGSAEGRMAVEVWSALKDDHYFWYNAGKVLASSQVDETKVYMLVVLQHNIKAKWYALPVEQRQDIRSYIVSLVLEYGALDKLPPTKHAILAKANSTLVQIVKYEWETSWTSFIADLCAASVKDMNICENNFSILRMLSEQIFDYSRHQLTQEQIAQLKCRLTNDFTTIMQLCQLVLNNFRQAKPSLLRACLDTLHAFLSWIPIYYVMYTDLIDNLTLLLSQDSLRIHALNCLIEIGALEINAEVAEERYKYLFMLRAVTEKIEALIPLAGEGVGQWKKKGQHWQSLGRGIANFYSQFFRQQKGWLDIAVTTSPEHLPVCRAGLRYLLLLLTANDDQIFKISLQFYHEYIGHYLESPNPPIGGLATLYPQIFDVVMRILVLKMAKPEEVLIVIDEDGVPVYEEIANTENSSLYEIMRELAAYLVRFNWENMRKHILQEIQKQQKEECFSFDRLNSLSWTVGSLCGFIAEEKQERNFFISALRILLHLCELKKGKNNKAVIASCIMYIVGQYPSFLRINWNFLKTVVKKLFEFMKEPFPGIMQMACNAFLKITRTNADQFIIVQQNQFEPYFRFIVRKIPQHSQKLEHEYLKLLFYQSLGCIIAAQSNVEVQLQLIKQVLGEHLFQFKNIIEAARSDTQCLRQEAVVQKLLFFFKLNETLAGSIGQHYANMLSMLSQYVNQVYLFYSGEVSSAFMNDRNAINLFFVRQMRSVKKAALKIYVKLVHTCQSIAPVEASRILVEFIFPLGTMLKDFQDSAPQIKEQQFVQLFTAVLEHLNTGIEAGFLWQVVDMVFASSLPLITSDYNSFPQIRNNFFEFLKSLVQYNFPLLFSLQQSQFDTILNCLLWAMRHQLSSHSDLGMGLLQKMLLLVSENTSIAELFYIKYHQKILTQVLDVLTDGFHRGGIDTQTTLLYILIHVTTQKIVNGPISFNQPQNLGNQQFLYDYLVQRLSTAFPNVDRPTTAQKIGQWFSILDQKDFKLAVTDYLILINRFHAQQETLPK